MAGWIFTVDGDYPQHVKYAAEHGFWDTKANRKISPGDDVFFWLTKSQQRLAGHFRATSSMGPMEPEPQPWDDLEVRDYRRRFYLEPVSLDVRDNPSWGELRELTGITGFNHLSYDIKAPGGVKALSELFAKVDYAWPPEIESDLNIHGPDAKEYRELLDIPAEQDERKRALRVVVERLGQPRFRRRLLEQYGHCLVSGWNVTPVLEAAHIAPYRGPHTNEPDNGLLLRADIHTLFDLSLLTVTPDYTIRVAPDLASGGYGRFDGKRLDFPNTSTLRPKPSYLQAHNEACEWLRGEANAGYLFEV